MIEESVDLTHSAHKNRRYKGKQSDASTVFQPQYPYVEQGRDTNLKKLQSIQKINQNIIVSPLSKLGSSLKGTSNFFNIKQLSA